MAEDSQIYRFKVGTFDCVAVSDGSLTYAPPMFPPPAAFLFSNAPAESLARVLREHDLHPEQWREWRSPYTCLVVHTADHIVLVDTGAGALAPSTGKLLQNLKAAGIAPDDIDTVILTHAHPDHTGGNVDSEGKPTFRKARHVIWKGEWDFWTSEKPPPQVDEHMKVLLEFARRNLPPIRNQLDLVDHETAILPGIGTVAAPGHTPGHMAVTISSGNQQLLCVSDTVLHPVHLGQPEWHGVVDSDPEQVVATRRRLLDKAAVAKALVFAFHFPFPGLGHVVREGTGWRWQPVHGMGQGFPTLATDTP